MDADWWKRKTNLESPDVKENIISITTINQKVKCLEQMLKEIFLLNLLISLVMNK